MRTRPDSLGPSAGDIGTEVALALTQGRYVEQVLAVLCNSPPPSPPPPPCPHLTPLPRSPSSCPDLKQQPAWLQVLELTQGQQVETDVLGVLVHQLTEGRQKSGLHRQDTPSEHSTPAPFLLACKLEQLPRSTWPGPGPKKCAR